MFKPQGNGIEFQIPAWISETNHDEKNNIFDTKEFWCTLWKIKEWVWFKHLQDRSDV